MIAKILDINNCEFIIPNVYCFSIEHYKSTSELNIVYDNGKIWCFEIRRIKFIRFAD